MRISYAIIALSKQNTERARIMTSLEFKAKLKKLNEKLMSAKTREEHSEADHAINMLVDSYRAPKEDKELAEANDMALHIAG